MALWDRFWSHVDPNGPVPAACPELGPCWLWTARLNHLGYGRFGISFGPEQMSAPPHRWLYEQLTGEPLAAGYEPDHLCRNRACVNPAHIEPVTKRENIYRGIGNPTIENSKKTHCAQGHPYDEANTYHRVSDNSRQCRACNRINVKASIRRRKEREHGIAFLVI
jgi:hypothetical protein